MTVLVVYPTVGSDTFDAVYADRVLAETRADGFRVHLDRRYPERNQRILDYVSDKTSVIILQLDDYMPRVWDVVAIEDFASDIPMMTRGMDVRAVEIGNEPLTMHKMSAATYAAICNRIAPQLSPLPVALACDVMRPNGWRDSAHVEWWRGVREAVSVHWDVAAIHPYRAGDPRKTWTHWPDWAHRHPWLGRWLKGSKPRELEHDVWRTYATRPLIVTEVGWNADLVSDSNRERYLYDELAFQHRMGTAVTCVYAHHGRQFGVLDERRRASAHGRGIRRWQERATGW